MSNSRRNTLHAAALLVGLMGCDATGQERAAVAGSKTERDDPHGKSKSKPMKLTIGAETFKATLNDNAATARLRAMLPLTLDMAELNGNEKHARLPSPLPTDETDAGTIQVGDLMLWGSDTLVVFYKGFPTTYSYTRLGRIDDAEGLAAAVGSGSVKVTFKPE